MLDRGTFTLPRLNAHLVVLAAAALTTLVAGALATTLVVFSGQPPMPLRAAPSRRENSRRYRP